MTNKTYLLFAAMGVVLYNAGSYIQTQRTNWLISVAIALVGLALNSRRRKPVAKSLKGEHRDHACNGAIAAGYELIGYRIRKSERELAPTPYVRIFGVSTSGDETPLQDVYDPARCPYCQHLLETRNA